MSPTLEDGDIVFYKKYFPYKSSLKMGDILIFRHPLDNINLIKRVRTISKQGIEVFGDNKNHSKDSNTFGLITRENILGIVTSKINSRKIFSDPSTDKQRGTFL